ncbi:MAG: archaellin/type IV pilin N-terminal domain-containing protein [Euryarchaeota archaeon]|nr:archaellin/type IV pilin N-terminal domain-containing protein [Euryarchaeota archaeon]
MFKNKKGVSPVIAVVLMIVVAVAISLVVYVWASGFVSEKTQAETNAGDFSFLVETRGVDNTNIRNTGNDISFAGDADAETTFLSEFDIYVDDALTTSSILDDVKHNGTTIGSANFTLSTGDVLTLDFNVATAPVGSEIKLVHKDSGTPIIFDLK